MRRLILFSCLTDGRASMTSMNQSLDRLNDLPADAAACRVPEMLWLATLGTGDMTAARPFQSSRRNRWPEADRIWWSLNEADWLEAFRAHPKIGEKKAAAGSIG